MANYSHNKKKFNLLQVLRGLAAILVLLAHCDLIFNQNYNQDFWFKIFNFGGSGVDFFFVLSGFLIFYLHQKDIGNKDKVVSFFRKRITRIYPIYWVVLTVKLSASWILSYNSDVSQRSSLEIIKAFLLFPQDRTILSSSFLGVSWTLSFEVFFYIIFGILMAISTRWSFLIIAAWILGTLANFTGLIDLSQSDVLLQFVFNEYNLEFVLGCLAAFLVCKYKSSSNQGMALLCVGIFLYTLSAINMNYKIVEISRIIGYGIPSLLMVIGSTYLETYKNIRVPNILTYIGDASYSIYLMHGFAINNITKLILKVSPESTQNIFLINFTGIFIALIALAFGCLIYSCIEKPLIHIVKPKLAKA